METSLLYNTCHFFAFRIILNRSEVPDEIFYHPMNLARPFIIDDTMSCAIDQNEFLFFRARLVKKLLRPLLIYNRIIACLDGQYRVSDLIQPQPDRLTISRSSKYMEIED